MAVQSALGTASEVQRRATRVKAREYSGPLGILAAGAIGLSMLCSVSALAMGDLNRYIPVTIEPINILNLAVSNLETAAALTEQAVTVFVPTETLMPTGTSSLTPPQAPSDTSTPLRFVTITPTLARKTREPSTPIIYASPTSIPPTRPPTKPPTKTNTPIPPTTAVPTTVVPPTTEVPTTYPQPATDTPFAPTPYP